MALVEREKQTIETVGGPNFDARMAMSAIDEIINEVYLPFRGAEGYGTERAILVAPPHAVHRENDAEHSWSVAFAGMVLHDMREELGLELPAEFEINRAIGLAIIHDIPEVKSDDVNAMTLDLSRIELKDIREQAAFKYFTEECSYIGETMKSWQDYERKDSAEAQFVSDIDKIIACRIIFLDGGRKWHNWEGEQTSRGMMVTRIRAKLLTDMGHKLFDVLEEDIDARPEVFPYEEGSDNSYQQLVIPGVKTSAL